MDCAVARLLSQVLIAEHKREVIHLAFSQLLRSIQDNRAKILVPPWRIGPVTSPQVGKSEGVHGKRLICGHLSPSEATDCNGGRTFVAEVAVELKGNADCVQGAPATVDCWIVFVVKPATKSTAPSPESLVINVGAKVTEPLTLICVLGQN